MTSSDDRPERAEVRSISGPSFEVRDLGRRGFEETYGLQQDLLRARLSDEVGDLLLLVRPGDKDGAGS